MNNKTLLRREFITGSIITTLCFTMFFVFTNAMSVNADINPVIDSVSPISATRLQTITIRGSGFGDTQPVIKTLSDGSINTVGGGKNMPGAEGTPVIQVNNYARNTWGSGVQDAPWTAGCAIGIFLEKWSDTEIVLGGFGSALSTTDYGGWTIKPGDPMRVVIITPNGIASYDTTVVSNGTESSPTSSSTPNQTPPIISSVSPISPSRLQTIYITGSGFGVVPPEMIGLSDGTVTTRDGVDTPTIQIRDNALRGGWTAGRQGDAIGIIIDDWTDNKITLGGFGTALGTNGEIAWSIMSGDPIDIVIWTSGGIATYSTTVAGSDTPPKTLLPTPTLAVYCKSSTTLSNFRVEITGNLTYNGTGLQCAPVLFSHSLDGGTSWNQLTLVNTDNNGDFSAVWLPSVTGNFLLKAEYLGDALYSETSTVVTLAVSASSEQTVFSVMSNSTISTLTFNSTSGELDFTVSGQAGTTGYVNVYVPKSLISDASNLKVFLDGNATSFNAESLADSWFISFTYPHSSHEVTLKMNTSPLITISESQLEQWLPYGIIIVLIVIIAFLLISKKESNNHTSVKEAKPER